MVSYPDGWTCERTVLRFEFGRERAAAEVERQLATKAPV
jgi:hypothetical protein